MRILLPLAFALVLGCHKGAPSLTDADVTRYIAAYKNLRAAGPGLAQQARAGVGLTGQANVEDAVKRAGFKSYAEFVKVNSKIAWAFTNGQATAKLDDTAHDVSEGEKTLMKNIADPNVPEAAKVEMRKALAEIQGTYAKNKKYANVAMGVSNALTNEGDVAVVMRHRPELEAAFQGR